jgi:hypothetical protein
MAREVRTDTSNANQQGRAAHGGETPDVGLNLRLLSRLREDFDRLRFNEMPIEVRLVHRASNAEFEGVKGYPPSLRQTAVHHGAGHREFRQKFDNAGNPLFREDPIPDAAGNPIVNSAGEAFDVIMPAFRAVDFSGGTQAVSRLRAVSERAGRIASELRHLPPLHFTREWQFSGYPDLWWAMVFEMAWDRQHPLLEAERELWIMRNQGQAVQLIPYDLNQINALADVSEFGLEQEIPKSWFKRLPDAWMSTISDAASACLDATELLLESLEAGTPGTPELPASGSYGPPLESPMPIKRRFAVALSFPGEKREFVEQVANDLKGALGENRVFYDRFHEFELTRLNLDLALQNIYSQDADLVAVFVCGEYSEKEWCGLEWRAIRELIKSNKRRDDEVMFFRFDNKPLAGLLSLDGFLNLVNRTPRQVADAILRRWTSSH